MSTGLGREDIRAHPSCSSAPPRRAAPTPSGSRSSHSWPPRPRDNRGRQLRISG